MVLVALLCPFYRLERAIPIDASGETDALNHIAAFVQAQASAAGLSVTEFFAKHTRQALDEVIDGPRTGRWTIRQLSKTEKTYVGTKVEILVRAALGVACGTRSDCLIDGIETDIKWSMHHAGWMIGPENVGEVCLGICTNSDQTTFSVGVFLPYKERLRQGANRDAKLSLSAAAREHIVWVVERERFPQNFLAGLDEETRHHIFAGDTSQERVRRLAAALPLRLIPRQAFQTVAMRPEGDPIRRLRQDRYNVVGLEGFHLLSTKQKGTEVRQILGLEANTSLPKDHWLSVPDDIYLRLVARPPMQDPRTKEE